MELKKIQQFYKTCVEVLFPILNTHSSNIGNLTRYNRRIINKDNPLFHSPTSKDGVINVTAGDPTVPFDKEMYDIIHNNDVLGVKTIKSAFALYGAVMEKLKDNEVLSGEPVLEFLSEVDSVFYAELIPVIIKAWNSYIDANGDKDGEIKFANFTADSSAYYGSICDQFINMSGTLMMIVGYLGRDRRARLDAVEYLSSLMNTDGNKYTISSIDLNKVLGFLSPVFIDTIYNDHAKHEEVIEGYVRSVTNLNDKDASMTFSAYDIEAMVAKDPKRLWQLVANNTLYAARLKLFYAIYLGGKFASDPALAPTIIKPCLNK